MNTTPKTPAIVIHHSADFDGLFCREIAKKFLPPDTKFIGWDFGDKPLEFPTEGDVYVLDLPCDRIFGFDWDKPETIPAQVAASGSSPLIWIDHHVSSIKSHPVELLGYRIDGVAACRLAWQWFNRAENPAMEVRLIGLPEKQAFVDRSVSEPYAVRLAGEYDIWDKRDPDAETFQFGLRSYELTEYHWRMLLDSTAVGGPSDDRTTNSELMSFSLLQNGALLQRYQQQQDASIMGRSFILDFEGLKFLALNIARCNSLTFAAKDAPETGHDALMGFYWDGTQWKFSLYHARHNTGIDLSAIAKKFGGGGHRGAAGMVIKSIPFIN